MPTHGTLDALQLRVGYQEDYNSVARFRGRFWLQRACDTSDLVCHAKSFAPGLETRHVFATTRSTSLTLPSFLPLPISRDV